MTLPTWMISRRAASRAATKGLTLVHNSAQRKHFLSETERDASECMRRDQAKALAPVGIRWVESVTITGSG
jgi:hypothetical protein